MPRFTQFELDAYNAKHKLYINSHLINKADDGKESILLNKIIKYCKDNGYYYFHDNSRKINAKGHPDLVIALPNKHTLWLELKAKNGRLSLEQKKVLSQLKSLGHEVYTLNNYDDFLMIIKSPVPSGLKQQ